MLFIYDQNFTRLGVVSNFSYLMWRKAYAPHSEMELHVDVTKRNRDLLQKGNIIQKQGDNEAMYIYYRGFSDESGVDQLIIKGFSVVRWTDRRILWGQYNFNATPETIIRRAITETMINPIATARKMNQVQLTALKNIGSAIEQQASYVNVYELIDALCNTFEIGIRSIFNGSSLYYDIYSGANRTVSQTENPRIVLSKSRSNLLKRSYEEADNDLKNTALIGGIGEGIARKLATIGNANIGLDRRELFIDARNVSNKKEVNGTETTISDSEYQTLLLTAGREKIQEYKEFISFDCELDGTKNNTKYNEDFFLGDLVTIKDEELDMMLNSRVMEVDEVYKEDGRSVFVRVGKSVPTLPQVIKRMVK